MNVEQDQIAAAPIATGPYGRLWRCAKRGEVKGPRADVAAWLVEAPWAHPVWHSYIVTLVHLRNVPGLEHAAQHVPGATHEFIVWAANPDEPRQAQIEGNALAFLHPPNFAAQIVAETDAAACERIEGTLMLILRGDLSPDTDFVHQWVTLFGDHLLRKPQALHG